MPSDTTTDDTNVKVTFIEVVRHTWKAVIHPQDSAREHKRMQMEIDQLTRARKEVAAVQLSAAEAEERHDILAEELRERSQLSRSEARSESALKYAALEAKLAENDKKLRRLEQLVAALA
jgi:hypothetical protein